MSESGDGVKVAATRQNGTPFRTACSALDRPLAPRVKPPVGTASASVIAVVGNVKAVRLSHDRAAAWPATFAPVAASAAKMTAGRSCLMVTPRHYMQPPDAVPVIPRPSAQDLPQSSRWRVDDHDHVLNRRAAPQSVRY